APGRPGGGARVPGHLFTAPNSPSPPHADREPDDRQRTRAAPVTPRRTGSAPPPPSPIEYRPSARYTDAEFRSTDALRPFFRHAPDMHGSRLARSQGTHRHSHRPLFPDGTPAFRGCLRPYP